MNTSTEGSRWRSLEEASAWARAQGIAGKEQWEARCKESGWRPQDVPSKPAKVYGEAFKTLGGWGGFLGTGKIANQHRKFWPIEQAAQWCQQAGVKSRPDWLARNKADPAWRPEGVPLDPARAYGESFTALGGWGGYLAKSHQSADAKMQENLNRQGFRSFEAARAWAQQEQVTSARDWKARSQEKGTWPSDLPTHPDRAYAPLFSETGGWGSFLGTGTVATQVRAFVSLEEASAFAIEQGVRSSADWVKRCEVSGWRPENIPALPSQAYGESFEAMGGWAGFLGQPHLRPSSGVARRRRGP